jgi:hypothetical protein
MTPQPKLGTCRSFLTILTFGHLDLFGFRGELWHCHVNRKFADQMNHGRNGSRCDGRLACSAWSINSATRSDHCCACSVGTASLLFADMIFRRVRTREQIAGWLKAGNERRLRAVGCETIYAFIYRAAQKAEQLWRYLTRHHKRRRPRRSRPSRDTIKDRVSIHERRRQAPHFAKKSRVARATGIQHDGILAERGRRALRTWQGHRGIVSRVAYLQEKG